MEPLKLSFVDDEFVNQTGKWEERKVARGIVVQEDGRAYVHLVKRDDIFGCLAYPETPGGGVDDGEDYVTAFKRECLEELGVEIEILSVLGEVEDEYALIGRKNLNRFFLAKAKRKVDGGHKVSKGDSLIEKTLLLTVPEIVKLYVETPEKPLFKLVKRRELPFWEAAARLIGHE